MRNVNVRTAKPEAKACKLTEGKGMFCWFTLTLLLQLWADFQD